jgi:purine-binding chemotaxis protein CheW
MLQRNAGPQSQPGVAGQTRPEGQPNGPRKVESAAPAEQYLVFSLFDREFALKAEYIQGVERMAEVTAIPNVVNWVQGVINLRGSICSVVDLRLFLDIEFLPYSTRTRLLSVKYNEMLIGLVVDTVSEMLPIQAKTIDYDIRSLPRWIAPYSVGLALAGKRPVILLDAARLLFADKMHHYST